MQFSPIRKELNKLIGHVIVLIVISDRKRTEVELEHFARIDVLTGVTNRRHFFELAEIQFEHAQRYAHSLAFLLLNVDHFKMVNDRYGHLAGDAILQLVARDCQIQLRSSDILARYGGEAIICLLPEKGQEGGLETAERVRRVIGQVETIFENQHLGVTVSVGTAVFPNVKGLTLERLIDYADPALYRAKASRRDRVSLWEESSFSSANEQKIEGQL